MAEQIDLINPEIRPAVTTDFYRVVYLSLDFETSFISIRLRGENNEAKSFYYENAEARNLMIILNKSNLTIQSLQRRILLKLIADGKITGSVSGAPD